MIQFNDNGRSRRRIALVMFALILGLFGGCATLNQLVQKPTVTFHSLDLEDASLLESTLRFNFKVNNPNPIGLRTGRLNYDLKINDSPFTSGHLDQGVSLPSEGTGTLSVPITVAYLDFLDSIVSLVQNRTATYDLKGTMAVGPFDIPFQTQGKFDLPRMPKISLDAVNIEKLSFTGASLNCRLRMDNPNAFNILFKQLDYTLKLGQTRVAKTSAATEGVLGQKGASTMNLALDLSFADIGRAGYQLLMGNSSTYQIEGQMLMDSSTLGSRAVPFSASGKVPFSR